MQIQIPYIEPLENVSDILDLVGNSKKFTDRVTMLNDLITQINAQLKTVEDINKLGELQSQAANMLSQAKAVKASADKYAVEAKADADKEAEKILATAMNKMAELAGREKASEERESQAAIRKNEQAIKEKELETRERQAEAELDRAAHLAREAQALQDKLTAKLGQLHSITVE